MGYILDGAGNRLYGNTSADLLTDLLTIDLAGVLAVADARDVYAFTGTVPVTTITGALAAADGRDVSAFTATVIGATGNAILGDRVLDNGLIVLSTEANALWLCAGDPTSTFATANSLRRANKNGTIFNAPVATANGSAVVSVAIADGVGTVADTVTHWAVVDTVASRVLARGVLDFAGAIAVAQQFTLPSFTIEMLAHG